MDDRQDLTDYEDIQKLMVLEDTLERVRTALNASLTNENDLEILLLSELKKMPGIKDSLSPKNKYIMLRTLTDDRDVEKLVDDWLRAVTDIQKLKHTLRQVEGRRDSLKKKISIEPK